MIAIEKLMNGINSFFEFEGEIHTYPNNTACFGEANWISKKSYVNILYYPLAEDKFMERVRTENYILFLSQLNELYKQLLVLNNGMILFSGNLNIYGFSDLKASIYDFSEPPDIYRKNSYFLKNKMLSNDYLIIGSVYNKKNQLCYLAFNKDNAKTIHLMCSSPNSSIFKSERTWSSLESFFEEILNVSKQAYRPNGKLVNDQLSFEPEFSRISLLKE